MFDWLDQLIRESIGPISALVNRTIPISKQHAADGGVQRDFVTSPIVLPALAR